MEKHKAADYILAVGVGALAAFAARKALTTTYEKVRDKPALPRPDQREPLPEALFIMLTAGAAAGLARFFARRYFLENRPRRRGLKL